MNIQRDHRCAGRNIHSCHIHFHSTEGTIHKRTFEICRLQILFRSIKQSTQYNMFPLHI